MIKELKEKAEKATRGPWEYCIFDDDHLEFGVHAPEHPDAKKSSLDKPWHMDHAVTVCKSMTGGKREDNAQYIAAANPQAILRLIEQLESAEDNIQCKYPICEERNGLMGIHICNECDSCLHFKKWGTNDHK